jgi:hypothetical protein
MKMLSFEESLALFLKNQKDLFSANIAIYPTGLAATLKK